MNAIDQVTVSATTYQTYRPRELAAPANNPDPTLADKYARYSWTVQVGIRGIPL